MAPTPKFPAAAAASTEESVEELQARSIAIIRRIHEGYPARIETAMFDRRMTRKEQAAELARLREEEKALRIALDMLGGDE